ncbi:hypothetical protein Fmac_019500 [Flemingia macrophylla]|uniref:FAF domain-containing protein n=1 Tax=Flemingia macrophylla TaxID=520843 RepID=A0ABD1M7Z8_9FABA
MATCGSLQHIFDTLMPENPTLLESLSWNQIKPIETTDQTPSFTEIFGELHFKESTIPISSSPSTPSSSEVNLTNNTCNRHKSSDSFSSLSSESLHLCTEGLGFESSDDVEDIKGGVNESWETYKEKDGVKRYVNSEGECRRSRVSEYPPPISSIGRSGKPYVCFRSYRSNGRFVLKEIRIPTHEFLHACREDGRLKLHFAHHDENIEEDDDDDDDEDGGGEDEEEEENMGEENDDCVTDDHVSEEQEIDAQVTSHSPDETAEILKVKEGLQK